MINRNSMLIILSMVLLAACKPANSVEVEDSSSEVASQDDSPDALIPIEGQSNSAVGEENSPTEEVEPPRVFESLDGGQLGNIVRDKITGCQWIVFYQGDGPLPPVERKDKNHMQICGPMPRIQADTPVADEKDESQTEVATKIKG